MCGRMTLTRSPAEIAEFFALAGAGSEADGRRSPARTDPTEVPCDPATTSRRPSRC